MTAERDILLNEGNGRFIVLNLLSNIIQLYSTCGVVLSSASQIPQTGTAVLKAHLEVLVLLFLGMGQL